jgi:ribosomal protein S16
MSKKYLKVLSNFKYFYNQEEDLKIRMFKQRSRYKLYIYKICVVNKENKLIECVGYFNANKSLLYEKDFDDSSFVFSKKIIVKLGGINRLRAIFWLSRGAKPTLPVFHLFCVIGLMKLSPQFPSNDLKEFIKLNSNYFSFFNSSSFQKE